MPSPKPNDPTRVITVPAKGAVLAAIEKYAADTGLPLGQSTAAIVAEWIAAAAERPATVLVNLGEVSTDDLFEELSARVTDASGAIDAANARAAAAEAQLAAVRQALGPVAG